MRKQSDMGIIFEALSKSSDGTKIYLDTYPEYAHSLANQYGIKISAKSVVAMDGNRMTPTCRPIVEIIKMWNV